MTITAVYNKFNKLQGYLLNDGLMWIGVDGKRYKKEPFVLFKSEKDALKIWNKIQKINPSYTYHGKFKSKILAARREREIPGSFILRKGEYYFVLKPRKNPFRLGSRRVRPVKSMRSPVHGRRKTTYRTKKAALRVAQRNPGTLIYDKITRIEGTKGKSSQYPGQKFFHRFKRPYPAMYGLKDGSLLIK